MIKVVRSYLLTAFRNLRRQPGYSLINITGLSLGMACCILILLWVHDELSYDNFHLRKDNIYRLTSTYEENVWAISPWAVKEILIKKHPEIESACWYTSRQMNYGSGDENATGYLGMVSHEFLDMFSFPMAGGNVHTALNDPNSVIISQKVANELFNQSDPIGSHIRFENGTELLVTGILDDLPGNTHFQFDMLARPDLFYGIDRLSSWIVDCSTYIELIAQADYKEFEEKITNVVNENDGGDWDGKMYIGLQPLRKIHTHALSGTDPVIYVRIFSIIALLVLLISCINFINLSISQAVARSKEIAFRKAVGSDKGDIIIQYLSESLIISFIAMFIALLIVRLILPAFNVISGKQLEFLLSGHYFLIAELLFIGFITGIISGLYPSLYFASYLPSQLFRSKVLNAGRQNNMRRLLIIFQFTTAIILIISVAVIMKQMNFIRDSDLGFERENIITVSLDRDLRDNYKVFKEKLLKSRLIDNVTSASNIPLNTSNSTGVYWEGINPENAVLMNYACVDYDYFETFGMQMVEGRSFSREFPSDMNGYIINETALKMTGFREAADKSIALARHSLAPLIGVVKDFHGTSLHNDIQPTIFFMFNYAGKNNMFIKVSGKSTPEAIEYIRETAESVSPGSFFRYSFLDEQFNQIYQKESLIHSLVKYFTILALFIAAMGLLGLSSFMAIQRTLEFAVRKVMGAQPRELILVFFREFTWLLIISNLIAWPIAFLMMKSWLANYSYRVSIGLTPFLIAGLLILLVACIVTIWHANKVSRCNLVESLKYE